MTSLIYTCDIDETGHGTGPELSCLHCHATTTTRLGITPIYLQVELLCAECLEALAEAWV